SSLTDRVDNGEIFLAEDGEQLLNGIHRSPALSAAAGTVLFDRLQNILRLIPDKTVVDINDNQRRALAVTDALAIAGRLKYSLILFCYKLVPNSFHVRKCLLIYCFSFFLE